MTNQSLLQFEWSPWLIIPCIVLAILGSYLLYLRDSKWGVTKYILAAIRFILIFLISALILEPIVKQLTNTIEKPTWVIGIDTSKSISDQLDSTSQISLKESIQSLTDQLVDQEFAVEAFDLSGQAINMGHLIFDQTETNIDGLLRGIRNSFEGRNIAGTLLISDGIHNQGISPVYNSYQFPIHTIGLGDSVPKSDIYIQDLKYNKLSYEGNQFPIAVTLGSKYVEGDIALTLFDKNGVVETKSLSFTPSRPTVQEIFLVDADNSGLQKYTIAAQPLDNEENTANNSATAYIDVIDGKQRILLLAAGPHPDIKAISSSIGSKNTYELVTYVPSLGGEKPTGKFDLIIFHQLPQRRAAFQELFNKYVSQDIPYLIIAGQYGDLSLISTSLDYISIQRRGNNTDQVTASINGGFSYFSLSDEVKNTLPKLPPLETAFSSINTSEQSSTLLYQRVGSVTTRNPLLVIDGVSEKRSALLLGEGLWRWRLYEYNQDGNTDAFDELILKMVQYLSTRQDKRKFKSSPEDNEVNSSEPVVFNTEIYNELYELTYGQTIDLTITDEDDEVSEYTFINSEQGAYEINGLLSGVYRYTAKALINGTEESVNGQFAVIEQNIEQMTSTANFDLLRTISSKNNGKFFYIDNFPTTDDLINNKMPGIVHTSESFTSLINLEWLLVLLILLLSIEWFTRKYNGFY